MGKPKIQRDIPAKDNIIAFLHCKKCLEEMPDGVSPAEWARTQAGWTEIGLQVWCNRHEINICHIDFEGMQHPANLNSEPHVQTKAKEEAAPEKEASETTTVQE